jgi:hypothetical protein
MEKTYSFSMCLLARKNDLLLYKKKQSWANTIVKIDVLVLNQLHYAFVPYHPSNVAIISPTPQTQVDSIVQEGGYFRYKILGIIQHQYIRTIFLMYVPKSGIVIMIQIRYFRNGTDA